LQNFFLLIASYVFYGWWDWRFLSLILFSTIVDYLVGIQIYNSPTKQLKKVWLWVSLGVNLGFLGFFMYVLEKTKKNESYPKPTTVVW